MAKGTFGERLKRERELREVTLDEVSKSTRISARFLHALENEDWPKLPGQQAAATALALLQVQQMDPNVRGFVAVSARYDAAPDRVYDDRGNVIFSESHSSCQIWLFQGPGWLCHADGAWIVHLHAPPQGGFNNHDAYVQVNGQNGTVSSASTNSS